MKRRIPEIPKEDLEEINRSFSTMKNVPTIVKDGFGNQIRTERKEVNSKSYAFRDFRGKKLKHQKSVIPVGGKQITVGVRGQLFDDIPEELRLQVPWSSSDFE